MNIPTGVYKIQFIDENSDELLTNIKYKKDSKIKLRLNIPTTNLKFSLNMFKYSDFINNVLSDEYIILNMGLPNNDIIEIDLSDKNLEISSYILILMYKSQKITESLRFRIIN